jgi:hypothetical protein
MKKAIAMKCSQKDWDSIKKNFIDTDILITEFEPYLVNNYANEELKIMNLTGNSKNSNNRIVHETFNAKIFLNACGIDCDVYEITKEQILMIAEKTQIIKEWFPDAFKKELEVGKWYKDKDPRYKGLICIEKYNGENNGITAYGFSWVSGSFDGHSRWCLSKESKDDLIESTPQEVEAALICEWEKNNDKFYRYELLYNYTFLGWNKNGECSELFKNGK